MIFYYDDLKRITVEGLNDETIHVYFQEEVYQLNRHENKMVVEPLSLETKHYVFDEFGVNYLIKHRFIVKTPYFETNYTDKNVELGSIVENNSTHFTLWSPTAARVSLVIDRERLNMARDSKGFYTYTIEKNLHGKNYYYEVENNGEVLRTKDPYGKASLENREASVVFDFNKMNIKNSSLNQDIDFVMEVHPRDFSMDQEVPFEYRGKLLSMLESHGDYGMKYILDSKVSHIQMMPVMDFVTVDEKDYLRKYNWGYDTMQYFSLEGSYSSNSKDPFQIMRDFSKVIKGYHDKNIGIIMDVVFNHVFDVESSSFQKTVPYYYFRYDEYNELSDGSFCENEFATEMVMARKLIADSCEFFHHTYGVDGFRFDLMGLMDLETMKEIELRCPEAKLYGEGWNMKAGIPMKELANMDNALQLPNYAFFNDQFRDFIGGDLKTTKGTWLRSEEDENLFATVMKGSKNLFHDSEQSVNYIECHDNLSLADRFNEKDVEFLNKILALSDGIKLFQIGQSFYRDKKNEANSYMLPDSVNRVQWSKLEDNKSMNDSFFDLISLKKKLGIIQKVEQKNKDLWSLIFDGYEVLVDREEKDLFISKR